MVALDPVHNRRLVNRWVDLLRGADARRLVLRELLPKDEWESQIVPDIAPSSDEIVVTKTTDSALTGTNLRLLLNNLGIAHVICCGIFTDQCVSSTVRSLADESYNVIVVEDCCAAATEALHRNELEIINRIYCHVMSSSELVGYLPLRTGA